MAQWVKKICLQCRRHRRHVFNPWVGKTTWRKKMAADSSILARKFPWTEEPGGLQSLGSQTVEQLSSGAQA